MLGHYNKCGIYLIKNLLTGESYVGSSNNIGKRWSTHTTQLIQKKHPNRFFQSAVNKYGLWNFIFGVLEYCSEETLITREQYYYDALECRYNIGSFVASPLRGSVKTKEWCQTMSRLHKGAKRYDITRKRLSESLKGNTNGRGEHTSKWKSIIVYDGVSNFYFQNAAAVANHFGLNRRSVNNACKNGKLHHLSLKYADC